MKFGIDSFAAFVPQPGSQTVFSAAERMENPLAEIKAAESASIDVFELGEHHRADFLDSAPAVILAAAAARTSRIRLTSAVTVLSAADLVRVFQQFATLDLLPKGRAEIVVGRGAFGEAFPLFGYAHEDYNALFAEKLELLLRLNVETHPIWRGQYRPVFNGQGVYPRPHLDRLPIWLGAGGTRGSFLRASTQAEGPLRSGQGQVCERNAAVAAAPALHRPLDGDAIWIVADGLKSRALIKCWLHEDWPPSRPYVLVGTRHRLCKQSNVNVRDG